MKAVTNKPKGARWGHLNGFVDVTLRDTKPDGTARTGQTDIAARTGLSVRMVKKALKKLIGRDIVKVLLRGRLNSGPSVYKVRGVRSC